MGSTFRGWFIAGAALLSLLHHIAGAASIEDGWKSIQIAPIELRIPADYRVENHSVDSQMSKYIGETELITVDLGRYSSIPALKRGPSDKNWKRWHARIHGREVQLVSSQREGKTHVLAHWPKVRPGEDFLFDGWSSAPDGKERLLKIIRSVRY